MIAGKVFYAVLNMGLGHAARSLPVIREFLQRGWDVVLGSNGRALEFLKREFPRLQFVVTPDYGIRYSKSRWLLPLLLWQTPLFLRGIKHENQFCAFVVKNYQPDLIISDHCYGMYHPRVPSYFISHQIYFAMPRGMDTLSSIPSRFNLFFHRKYKKVIIPDYRSDEGGLLSGKLSRLPDLPGLYAYVGLLSSISESKSPADIDFLISISGPEPQRTLLEMRLREQINFLPGKKVMVLGKSESVASFQEKDVTIFSHVSRAKMGQLFNRAKFIISRPGYSTLMELAELGKPALLIPTPGQTEQQYLASRVFRKGWYYFIQQNELELSGDWKIASQYAGLYKPNATGESVRNIFEKVLKLPGK